MKTPSLILMTIILCNLSIPINAQILTSRQQKEDFDTLYSLLHQVHPDLFLYQTQKEFEKNYTYYAMGKTIGGILKDM